MISCICKSGWGVAIKAWFNKGKDERRTTLDRSLTAAAPEMDTYEILNWILN